MLAALDTRAADGQALNLGERTTPTMRAWVEQILHAATAELDLVRGPDRALPPDLAVLGASAQHLLADTHRAEQLLDWAPGDPDQRVAQSVRWHLSNPSALRRWSEEDTTREQEALAAARNDRASGRRSSR